MERNVLSGDVVERLNLNETEYEEIRTEHIHRYQTVAPLMDGKKVLDAACGTGYGTYMLAEHAECVVGIDIDADLIHSLQKNNDRSNVSFRQMSIAKLEFEDASFDAVVSFETIEHVDEENQVAFLREVHRVLKPNGIFVVSTPDVDVLRTIYPGYHNPFHLKEYNKDGFYRLLTGVFKNVQFYYQNYTEASIISGPEQSVISSNYSADDGKYLIAACSDCRIYDTSLGSALFPPAQKYYAEKYRREAVYATLYIDSGSGYSQENSVQSEFTVKDKKFHVAFDVSAFSSVEALRFDPSEIACNCSGLSCIIDGENVGISAMNAEYSENGKDYFFNGDPQYAISLDNVGAHVRQVEISGHLEQNNDWKIAEIVQQSRAISGELDGLREEISLLKGQLQDISEELKQEVAVRSSTLAENERVSAELEQERTAHNSALAENVRISAELEQERVAHNSALAENERVSAELEQERVAHNSALAENERVSAERNYYEDAFHVITNSMSWKITYPIRFLLDLLKRIFRKTKTFAGFVWKALRILFTQGPGAVKRKIVERKARKAFRGVNENASPNNCYRSNMPEPVIPDEWISMLPVEDVFSILIPVKRIQDRKEYLRKALKSLCRQKYKNFEVVIACREGDFGFAENVTDEFKKILDIHLVPVKDDTDKNAISDELLSHAKGKYVGFLEQEDTLSENAMAYVAEGVFEMKPELCIIPDEVAFEDGEYSLRDNKNGVGFGIGGVKSMLRFGMFINRGDKFSDGSLQKRLMELKQTDIYIAPWIGCRSAIVEDLWETGSEVRFLAFYLPQFHAIPENDEWWGKGFTEWTNVKKAKPLYEGHKQPRIPSELGYYDLGDTSGKETLEKQIILAKEYGIDGFCYYYYWFDDGRRLLEKPLNRHRDDKSIDFPFCVCWANENWTRQWDGNKNEVLMPQSYKEGWAEKFANDLLPYIKDERYIRVNGAPYVLIYNLADIPSPAEAINTWRRVAAENGIERLHISAVRRSLESNEFELSGYTLDSLTDFPPHLIGNVDVDLNDAEKYRLNHGQIKDYRKAVAFHMGQGKLLYTYFRTVMLQWDNTARRGKNAYIFEKFSYDEYLKWLYLAKWYALRQNRDGENLVFINAWNEWAEGTYLEPSASDGRAALETTQKAKRMRC